MIEIYPTESIKIYKTENGFILNTKGNRQSQEDDLDGVYVFNNIKELLDVIESYYE